MAYSAHHPIQLITPGSSTSRTPLLEKSLANSQRQRYPSLDLLATPPPEKPPQKITEEESWDALEKTLRLIPCEWKTCQCVLGSINLLATHIHKSHCSKAVQSARSSTSSKIRNKPFLCKILSCQQGFSSSADLMNHVSENHLKVIKLTCPVEACNRSRVPFNKLSMLISHLELQHCLDPLLQPLSHPSDDPPKSSYRLVDRHLPTKVPTWRIRTPLVKPPNRTASPKPSTPAPSPGTGGSSPKSRQKVFFEEHATRWNSLDESEASSFQFTFSSPLPSSSKSAPSPIFTSSQKRKWVKPEDRIAPPPLNLVISQRAAGMRETEFSGPRQYWRADLPMPPPPPPYYVPGWESFKLANAEHWEEIEKEFEESPKRRKVL